MTLAPAEKLAKDVPNPLHGSPTYRKQQLRKEEMYEEEGGGEGGGGGRRQQRRKAEQEEKEQGFFISETAALQHLLVWVSKAQRRVAALDTGPSFDFPAVGSRRSLHRR